MEEETHSACLNTPGSEGRSQRGTGALLVSAFLPQHKVSLGLPSVHGSLQETEGAAFLGNSWTAEGGLGPTQRAASQDYGDSSGDLVPDAQRQYGTDWCCKALSQVALASLVL